MIEIRFSVTALSLARLISPSLRLLTAQTNNPINANARNLISMKGGIVPHVARIFNRLAGYSGRRYQKEKLMKSPKDKYMNDPEYHHLVDMLEQLIHQARFTPSELREACVLASINYEMKHIRDMQIDPRTDEALRILDDFASRRKR